MTNSKPSINARSNHSISSSTTYNDRKNNAIDSTANNTPASNTNPDTFIGGTTVVHRETVNQHDSKTGSLFDDDYENETPSSDADLLTTSSSNSLARTSNDSPDIKHHSKQSTHKIFTFSLPFGGKPFIPNQSITQLVTSLLPIDIDKEDNKFSTINKEEIKQKLKRSDSITTLEEIALFNDEKGIDNVRTRAFKKTFEMETLKQTFKTITASAGECTHDGYEYTRLESVWNELQGDFLFMGGYRGSILRDANTHKRLWIPMKAGLNLKKINLLIGPDDKDEVETQREIIADKMLTHIGPVDISRRLMKKINSNPNTTVYNFGYDWRLSLQISAEHLRKKLQDIYDKQQEKKGTYIIAHSMGGLVAHKVLQENTHLIRGLIYVGSPSECSNILGPLKFGDEVLMNKNILSKEANFFMRSSFYFLPIEGTCFVNKETYEKIDIDFFDPKIWVKLGLSPLVDSARCEIERKHKQDNDKTASQKEKNMAKTEVRKKQPQPGISTEVKDFLGFLNPVPMIKSMSSSNAESSEETSPSPNEKTSTLKALNPATLITKLTSTATDAIGLTESKIYDETNEEVTFHVSFEDSTKYLQRTLKRAKEYLISLNYISDKKYPPLVIVYGNTVPTVRGVKIEGLEDIKLGHYNDFYYGPGDGVVHHKWLLPEQKGFPVDAKIASSCGHVSLLSDLESMAKAFISIIDKEKQSTTQTCK